MAEKSSRFVSLNKPIDKFIEEQETNKNKNTLSKTRRDISFQTEFLRAKIEARKVEEITTRRANNKMAISANLL